MQPFFLFPVLIPVPVQTEKWLFLNPLYSFKIFLLFLKFVSFRIASFHIIVFYFRF